MFYWTPLLPGLVKMKKIGLDLIKKTLPLIIFQLSVKTFYKLNRDNKSASWHDKLNLEV